MEVSVDLTSATNVLAESLQRVQNSPTVCECIIKPVIDFVLIGKNCLTYRYILLTALTAKATNDKIDVLSLQAGDSSDGAYDARSLCAQVVFPFQREFLDDVLDGSNDDPLVNNPGRHPRLTKENKAAAGDPRQALDLMCDYLPSVKTSEEAKNCLDYFIVRCLDIIEMRQQQEQDFDCAILSTNPFEARTFMDELLDKNFGGTALLLVASTIFSILFPMESGYRVVSHPVNQSGASKRQISDLDILDASGNPFLVVELKDKPFTETEVEKAAQTAFNHQAPSMLFIAGRNSSFDKTTPQYFNEVKASYMQKGMMIGIVAIDALVDFFFATNYAVDAMFIFDAIRNFVTESHASPEAARWVYRKTPELHTNQG